jgi:hypothetical protein
MAREKNAALSEVLPDWVVHRKSRRSVITGLKWSMVNLETGIMQRKERGAVKRKSDPRQSGWVLVSWHICRDGTGLDGESGVRRPFPRK